MRILQINSVCDRGSTGRTTRELADFLEENGHECYVAYGQGTTTYKKSFKIRGILVEVIQTIEEAPVPNAPISAF